MEVGHISSVEGKESKGRHKSQRPSHSHSQEFHKSTKLVPVIYMQKTGADPRRPCACCFSLYEHVCSLLSWFGGSCSWVLHFLWFLQSLRDSLSFEGRNLMETSYLETLSAYCLAVGLCICSYMLLEEDSDEWIKHLSMSIAEYR